MIRMPRRSVLKSGVVAPALLSFMGRPSRAANLDKFQVVLDWIVNPDHAPLFVAKYIGAYEKAGLDVELIPPTDPDLPPRLLAAGRVDMALSYQAELYLLVDQGIPLVRSGTLIDKPLDTLTTLPSTGIRSLADFKGKKIGYSVSGVEEALISTMLGHVGLSLSDVTLVNVNFALVTSLISGEVDGVIGTYLSVEDIELKQRGLTPVVFRPEDYGVPASDELIMLSRRSAVSDSRLPRFLGAVEAGVAYLRANTDAMWQKFSEKNSALNDRLDKASWAFVPPYFATNPAYLDVARYTKYRDFMKDARLIQHSYPISDYAVEVPT